MSDQTSFIQSLLVGIIFVPYHFICDVARKLVFLKREKIEALLLGSTIFSAVTLAATTAYYAYTGMMHLFDGNFPVIVPLASTALMFLIYAYFKSTNFKLFDNLNDFVTLDAVLQEVVDGDDVELIDIMDSADEIELTDEEDTPNNTESVASVSADNTATTATDFDSLDIESEILALEPDPQPANNVSNVTQDTKVTQNTKVTQDNKTNTNEASTPTQALSKEAKKALYKSKMLKALRGKLSSVKTVDSFSDEEINRLCMEEPFLKSSDFSINEIDFSFDDLEM